MRKLPFFILCIFSLFGEDRHYDCIFIGTSPQSLFEALYHHGLGKSILILEEGSRCGGSWQSVDVCGVAHADLGCHEIGNSDSLREFLHDYAGCSLVPLDTGYYFSGGAYELVNNLEKRIQNSSIDLLKNHKVDRVCFAPNCESAIVTCMQESFLATKVYAPAYSYFPIDNEMPKELNKTLYHHLYLLIQDATSPRFAYKHGISNAVRMMNLTNFVDLAETGQQLIVFQTWNMDQKGENFLTELKAESLVDPSAYILKAEWFTYEQYPPKNFDCAGNPCFEQLQTHDFKGMANHISRWKEAIAPYMEAVP